MRVRENDSEARTTVKWCCALHFSDNHHFIISYGGTHQDYSASMVALQKGLSQERLQEGITPRRRLHNGEKGRNLFAQVLLHLFFVG